MNKPSFFWHDYETFGISPSKDRPVQFAGIRTDLDFNIIDQPFEVFCQPADDFLPNPQACLITGITPQQARQKGIPEAEFAAKIHQQLSTPATCTLGYNSIRFDDEVTRFMFYRNFFDPYAREWQNGNSRWDIIDLVRITYALRPDGIEWPRNEDGLPSFKLEHLTAANNLTHEAAHDALSDVYATIAIAKLIREKQPRLYDFVYNNKNKHAVSNLLDLQKQQPLLHASGMIRSEFGSTAMVVPVAAHPTNKNGIIVVDLRQDPTALISEEPEEIAYRVFSPQAKLPEGIERIALKTVHINKCPVLAPLNTLNADAAKRTKIDIAEGMKHLEMIKQCHGLDEKIQQVFMEQEFEEANDPDLSLYSGGFFSPADRSEMNQILKTTPTGLAQLTPRFEDSRLAEMFFRYKARNYPDQLSFDEQQEWLEYRRNKLNDRHSSMGLGFAEFDYLMTEIRQHEQLSEKDNEVLSAIESYRFELEHSL
ncbi:MAG: exodeoxyribonuclease I [Gammaproteobacteria bacterium]|nr:exodeoxyribonuclease I [Gammaproteobacteria bacterium]